MELSASEQTLLTTFCNAHQLPAHYVTMGEAYFFPLAKQLAELSNKNTATHLLIGINGCQGSGKSTLAAFLEEALTKLYNKKVANLSIDDFYHTKEHRQQLSAHCHPLFKTRGVPGTHDITLLQQTLANLTSTKKNIPIVRFNKANDDRYPKSSWDQIDGPADIILLEGWCVGVTKQNEEELLTPINTLEHNEDEQGIWRHKINALIAEKYEPLFATLDHLIMLKAPSFQCVYDWRQKQEDNLRHVNTKEKNTSIMTRSELKRFIEHYQRLTEHMLCSLPQQADIVFELNPQHQITRRMDNGK